MFSYEIFCTIAGFCDYATARNISIAINLKPDDYDLMKYCDLHLGFQDKIHSEIKKMGMNDPYEFFEVIRKYDAVISGSFILKLLTGDSWESGDIDIYASIKDTRKITKAISKIIFIEDAEIRKRDDYYCYVESSKGREILDFDMKVLNSKIKTKDFKLGSGTDNIGEVYTFPKFKDITIQIIGLNGINETDKSEYKKDFITRYINQTFDFDFCKNMYDGHTLIVSHPQSIKMRTTDISKHTIPMQRFGRIIKYTKRGFAITGLNEYCHNFLSRDSIITIANMFEPHHIQRRGDENYIIYISTMLINFYLGNFMEELGYKEFIIKNILSFDMEDRKICNTINMICFEGVEKGHYKTDKKDARKTYYGGCASVEFNYIELILTEKMFLECFDEEFVILQNNIISSIKNSTGNNTDIDDIIYEWISKMFKAIGDKDKLDDMHKRIYSIGTTGRYKRNPEWTLRL